jgi:hypothetical protein
MGGRDGPEWLGTMDRNQWARWTGIPIQAFLKPGVTRKKAWEDTKLAYFKKGAIAQGNLLIPIPPEDHEAPSLFQFEQVVKEMDRELALTKRNVSTTTWNLRHRAVLGSSRHRVFGPAARFEIDATIVDVYLVSVFNRAWLIGRPVLYVVVDVFSRMVVGFYLGLEGPSWEGARLALFNAFSDKAAFCRQFDIEIPPELWPCRHLPHKLLCDNGELKSKASDSLPKEFGITIQNAAVRRPDWKPNVEQQFNLINNHTVHFEPGALNPRLDDIGERRALAHLLPQARVVVGHLDRGGIFARPHDAPGPREEAPAILKRNQGDIWQALRRHLRALGVCPLVPIDANRVEQLLRRPVDQPQIRQLFDA